MRNTILAMTVILATGNAQGITIDDYKKRSNQEKNPYYLQTYITGVGEGLFWANVALKGSERQRLYCPPSNFSITGHNYISILDKEIDSGRHEKDTELGLILLMGLQKTFPCSQPT